MSTPKFDRAAHCRKIASKGGKATVKKHGSSHMAAIGSKGFLGLASKFRNVTECKLWLASLGAFHYWKNSGLPDTGKFPADEPLPPWHNEHTEF